MKDVSSGPGPKLLDLAEAVLSRNLLVLGVAEEHIIVTLVGTRVSFSKRFERRPGVRLGGHLERGASPDVRAPEAPVAHEVQVQDQQFVVDLKNGPRDTGLTIIRRPEGHGSVPGCAGGGAGSS